MTLFADDEVAAAVDPSSADNVFFMIGGTEAERRTACDLAGRLAPPGSQRRPESVLHTTLVLVGVYDPRAVSRAIQIGDLMRGAAFRLVFDRLERFGNGAVVLGCAETPDAFLELRRQLTQAARSLGKDVMGGQRPHLTVAYGGPAFEPIRLDEPLVWEAREVLLVRSLHGKAIHKQLGRWSVS